MGDSENLREIIERVVSGSLATHITAFKEELVEHACEQLEGLRPAAPEPAVMAGAAATDLLNAAVNSVLDSSSQADILGALVEGAANFAERAALFVIRGGSAIGWRATGLDNNEGIKSVAVELNEGLAARAYQEHVPASASAVEFDAVFVSTYGAPADGTNALVLPLVVRDKVAALVYADAGLSPGGKLDASALECLVRFAGLWLEIVAVRKSGVAAVEHETEKAQYAAAPAEPAHPAPPPPPPEMAPEPSYAVPAAPVPVMSPGPSYMAPEPSYAAPAAVAVAPAISPAPAVVAPAFAPEDEEVHRKALRFAKLLVDEIKLYNQAKVAEGRARKDLYARLRDDIDKSRATYDKRYGATAAASGNYFSRELIRILANDDPSLLGGGFSG
jgi:hypothetical protein